VLTSYRPEWIGSGRRGNTPTSSNWLSCLRRYLEAQGEQAEAIACEEDLNIRPWRTGTSHDPGVWAAGIGQPTPAPGPGARPLKRNRLARCLRPSSQESIGGWWGLTAAGLGLGPRPGAWRSIHIYLTDYRWDRWRHACCHRTKVAGTPNHRTNAGWWGILQCQKKTSMTTKSSRSASTRCMVSRRRAMTGKGSALKHFTVSGTNISRRIPSL